MPRHDLAHSRLEIGLCFKEERVGRYPLCKELMRAGPSDQVSHEPAARYSERTRPSSSSTAGGVGGTGRRFGSCHVFTQSYFAEAVAQMALIATSSPSPSGTATLGVLAKYQRRLSKGDRTVRLPGSCK
jgi:hypothetical protein